MTTSLLPTKDCVNLLEICHVGINDIESVDAWLFAIGMTEKERDDAIRQILSGESLEVSNIEYRVTVKCCV